MVRPSNPKLMARVLEAVVHLAEGKGSLTRDVLKVVKQNSSGPVRNFTMQVRKALKNAVNAGLLRCKSGRYKMQMEFNPISHRKRHRREETKSHEIAGVSKEMDDELPVGGIDISRKVQDRKKSSRKKRAPQKSRKRSATRVTKRKVTKRRAATTNRRVPKMSRRARRKTTGYDEPEDWPTRRRRMMSKSRSDDEEENDEEEEEEEGEEEEAEGLEEEEYQDEEEEMRDTRNSPRMKSVSEDRYSDLSGDGPAVGRHRSRRSKHLAKVEKSPSRRTKGDGDAQRKSTRRSTSRRRRSQPRERNNRQVSDAEEQLDEQKETLEDDRNNQIMDMDEDQAEVERTDTPPENRENE